VSQAARRLFSVEEYVALEEAAEYKSEYFRGEIFAMAGGLPEHNLICLNVGAELRHQLAAGPCRVYGGDQRVKVSETGLYTYPDVTVVCEEPLVDEIDRSALVNPVLIVEVLSEGTEAYDRGDKFGYYRELLTLQEYVMVGSDQWRVERYTRQAPGADWLMSECSDIEGTLALPSIGCLLELRGVYAKVELPPRQFGRRRRRVRVTRLA